MPAVCRDHSSRSISKVAMNSGSSSLGHDPHASDLSPQEFEQVWNPSNCEVWALEKVEMLLDFLFCAREELIGGNACPQVGIQNHKI